MNPKRLGLLLCCWLFSSGCTNNYDLSRLGDSGTLDERRLVVTFTDRTINRTLPGNAVDGYRVRGQYGNSGWGERLAQQLADRHRLQVIAQWPVTALGVSCVVYQVPEKLQLQQVMAELQNDGDVALVQRMQTFTVHAEKTEVAGTHRDPYLPLQAGFNALGVSEFHKIATGRGVRIALIDSGVDVDHPDLQGQIKYSENSAPEPIDHNFAEMHGTAVAGVLSARPDNGIGIAGIAPDADVLAFRACWPDKPGALAARCNSFTLAVALNQAIRMNSHIINLSLSGPDDPLLRLLVQRALDENIIVIAAVPGKDQGGGFPANVPGVLAVGRGHDGSTPEIVAPGEDILTTLPHQTYDFMTGSSFATPHVAGLAALMLQANPGWHLAEVKQRLLDGGHRLFSLHIDNADTADKQKEQEKFTSR